MNATAEPDRAEVTPSLSDVLVDPSTSYWLKGARNSSLQRGPVDALNDAKFLITVLFNNLERTLRMELEHSEILSGMTEPPAATAPERT